MSEHTPITGELRGKMDTLGWYDEDGNIVFTTGGTPVSERACLAINSKTFDRLCDAIDTVHAGLERENAELYERLAALDESADSMHDGWVRLPVDADGETIHAGDVMVKPDSYDNRLFTVGGMTLYGDQWSVQGFAPHMLRHHEPTVEDVLREMHAELDEVTALYVGEAIGSDERDRDEARIFAEYAAKLRLAGDAE